MCDCCFCCYVSHWCRRCCCCIFTLALDHRANKFVSCQFFCANIILVHSIESRAFHILASNVFCNSLNCVIRQDLRLQSKQPQSTHNGRLKCFRNVSMFVDVVAVWFIWNPHGKSAAQEELLYFLQSFRICMVVCGEYLPYKHEHTSTSPFHFFAIENVRHEMSICFILCSTLNATNDFPYAT